MIRKVKFTTTPVLVEIEMHFLKQEQLESGEEEATCPSCSLIVKVIYNKEEFFQSEEIMHSSSKKELTT
ncbi:hypothetical protein OUZ56_031374 [Daphnia magna]|uniref:Uncharacterized protein n=1 Tax=Daphnia magna TaxID=35525 RepID=A0ABQ9ZU26_9CRUS|nr:hypothetical protein OUZ56_031374 [Daphnia magna]